MSELIFLFCALSTESACHQRRLSRGECPQYFSNDFGDTHSLMLIVDSLSVQNTLAQLLPTGVRDCSLKQGMPFPKSRRWRDADSMTTPANDSTWRLAA